MIFHKLTVFWSISWFHVEDQILPHSISRK